MPIGSDRIGRLRDSSPSREAKVPESNSGEWSPFGGPEGELPRPEKIRNELPPVPALTPELLPRPFFHWLPDTTERIGCPLEYPAITALIGVATVVGRKVAIRPKRRDDWTVTPNL